MIGLDTNVLLRAVTQDDPAQSPVATRLLSRLTEASPGYVNTVVLVELVWSLERGYKYGSAEISGAIEALLASTAYMIEQRDAVGRALTRAEEHGIGIADALICELNQASGCTSTLTFDARAARVPGFTLAT